MKVDFSKIEVKTITGDMETVDLRTAVGNILYMQGMNIKECSLGLDVFHSDGPMELSDEQTAIVRVYVKRLPYVFQEAVERALAEQ